MVRLGLLYRRTPHCNDDKREARPRYQQQKHAVSHGIARTLVAQSPRSFDLRLQPSHQSVGKEHDTRALYCNKHLEGAPLALGRPLPGGLVVCQIFLALARRLHAGAVALPHDALLPAVSALLALGVLRRRRSEGPGSFWIYLGTTKFSFRKRENPGAISGDRSAARLGGTFQ